jgi:bifunctional DNA-binding transcriptional regulator/antitoxin component of YhaV-PrlF toxin-antitoxin module
MIYYPKRSAVTKTGVAKRGQVTIAKALQEQLGIRPGTIKE